MRLLANYTVLKISLLIHIYVSAFACFAFKILNIFYGLGFINYHQFI
jgi:hypothetical protein